MNNNTNKLEEQKEWNLYLKKIFFTKNKNYNNNRC